MIKGFDLNSLYTSLYSTTTSSCAYVGTQVLLLMYQSDFDFKAKLYQEIRPFFKNMKRFEQHVR